MNSRKIQNRFYSRSNMSTQDGGNHNSVCHYHEMDHNIIIFIVLTPLFIVALIPLSIMYLIKSCYDCFL